MKEKLGFKYDRYLVLFGLQIATLGFYYSIISFLVESRMIKFYYFYPKYSISLLVLIFVGVAFGIMSFGYSYVYSISVFEDKSKRVNFLNISSDYAYNRSVIFLRDSLVIIVLVIVFIYHFNGLIESIIT